MSSAWVNKLLNATGTLDRVYSEQVTLNAPFIDIAARFADNVGTVVLLSGCDLDCSRYHILGTMPWLTLTSFKQNIMLKLPATTYQLQSNPFDILKEICAVYQVKDAELPPVACGMMGYLGYDLKDHIETLPRTSINDLGLPDLVMYAPSLILIYDKNDGTARLMSPCFSRQKPTDIENLINGFKRRLVSPQDSAPNFKGDHRRFKSNFEKAAYMAAVNQIKAYIAAGHVYQVNLSQRFKMGFHGDGYALFNTLYNTNPAPFYAYVNAGNHQIVSTSPERFLKRRGPQVETRPIKGTRPRGQTASEDDASKRDLIESTKDDAELSMIVDLLRNDIGKVCKSATVKVTEHKRLEAYQNVYHLVSVIKGTLEETSDSVDLIKATFPGGSITGCPKIRAMEIIDELEPCRRHIYTGSIGYIGFDDTMDLSIAIRTATIVDNQVLFSVGGGIVQDSDPLSEFEETLHKGRTLMDVFKGSEEPSQHLEYAWHNGQLIPTSQVTIPVTTLGFQYGFGFFETLRVTLGRPHNLDAHVDRFNQTWKSLFATQPPDLTWEEIIKQVVKKNALEQKTAALKIMASKGSQDGFSPAVNLSVLARPYAPRLAERDIQGLHLVTYPEERQTPLAKHKTMNYLYYYLAGQWAHAQGFDEALILNPDDTVSETNTANLLLIKGKQVIQPSSPAALPGTMEKLVCQIFTSWDFNIESRPVKPAELFEDVQVIVTNSLVGALPVISIDGRHLSPPTDLCTRLNDVIF